MPPIASRRRTLLFALILGISLAASTTRSVFAQTNLPAPSPNSLSSAGNGVPTPVPSITKNPASVAALTVLVAAHGWLPAQMPQDVVITGVVSRHMGATESADGPTGMFTVKLRGRDLSPSAAATSKPQFSYSEGDTTFMTNGLTGVIMGASGKAVRIPAHSAAGALGMLFPVFSVVTDFTSADVAITPLGSKTINNEACTGIHMERKFADSDAGGKVRALVAPIDLWISNSSGHLVRADYLRVAADNHYAALKETAYFSDYRVVNGMAVPFQHEIYLDKNHIKTLKFDSVQFNTGLSDADFNVKAAVGGAQ